MSDNEDIDVTIPLNRSRGSGGSRFFKTPDDFRSKIASYFRNIEEDKLTRSGLLLHLDMSKSKFKEYLLAPGYSEIAEMAMLRIENIYESSLRAQGGPANIFALKQFGWTDKIEQLNIGNNGNPVYNKVIREVVGIVSSPTGVTISTIHPTSTSLAIPHTLRSSTFAKDYKKDRIILDITDPPMSEFSYEDEYELPTSEFSEL